MKEIEHYDENNSKEVIDKKYDLAGNSKNFLDSSKTAKLRSYLERVVTEGSGKGTFIEGYHIAGKTGTAQKAGVGGYQSGKYVSSFAGMAPSNDPKVTILISIDEPDPSIYYASQTAVPTAKQVFTDVLNYLAVKGDIAP